MRSRLSTLCLLTLLLGVAFPVAAQLLRIAAPPAEALDVVRRSHGFPAEAVYTASVDRQAAITLRPGQGITLDLPRALRYQVVFERFEELPSGALVWVGYLEGQEKTQRVILTLAEGAVFGRILTPEGEFVLETNAQGQWLYDLKRADVRRPHSEGTDAPRAPPGLPVPPGFETKREKAGPPSTVDLLLVYTPSMVSQYGSQATVRARLDHLVALSNQAYLDSGIALSLRIVRTEQVSYSDTTGNDTALYEITGSNGGSSVPIPPALTPVAGWRNTYGADLVLLLRSYSTTYQGGSCGIAWLSVSRWSGSIYSSPEFGYGVVSDGWDGGYGCGEYTFAHEAGHLFGATHDRVTEGQPTGADPNLVYDYAYGYGVAGSFYTIMAYGSSFGWPTMFPLFSNPNLTCNGVPCGKAVGQPDQAYNALALENTRELIAAYRSPATPITPVFVSALTGSDANVASNCQVNTPCRTFAAAATVVSDHGEIVALDSGGYGPLSIPRSMTLTAALGEAASITVTSGNGVNVIEPAIAVTLRGLTILNSGGTHGVEVNAAAKLTVENCQISGFASGAAIRGSSRASLRVLKSLLRDNGKGVEVVGGATASIHRSRVFANTVGILATNAISGRTTAALVNETVVAENTTGMSVQATASGATSVLTLARSVVTRNSVRGLEQSTSGGGVATMESAGRNTVRQNTTNVFGTLTAVPGI